MMFKLPNTKYYPSKSTLLTIAFSLMVFINFTVAIQYVNLNDFNISLNEIVEEEEEVHRNDLLDDLVNNTKVISLINYDLSEEPLLCKYHTDVLTPPPQIIIHFI